jgi:hypothetical protein
VATYTITITISDDRYAKERCHDLPAPESIEEALHFLIDYSEDGRENFQKEKIHEAAGILLQEAIVVAVNSEEVKKLGDKVNTDVVDVGDNIKVSRWSMNAEERLKRIGRPYAWPAVEVVKCQR